METKASVIRSGRKSLAIEVTAEGRVVVRAPYKAKLEMIESFLHEKRGWIERSLSKVKRRRQAAAALEPLTPGDVEQLTEKAKLLIPLRVAHYAGIVGVSYGRITVRCQKTRWGSCSSGGNLNFNCLLMLAPPKVLDYVVVHELCHRKQMNHSEAFWQEVEKVIPEHAKYRAWLRQEGSLLMERVARGQ
ncbi:MAG: M48 family metallopeptidase [Anaerovoracaceae bacterium]